MAKILIVDDEPMILKVMSLFLKGEKHEIAVACNGLQARELLLKDPPDLLITDVNMPLMDGLISPSVFSEISQGSSAYSCRAVLTLGMQR